MSHLNPFTVAHPAGPLAGGQVNPLLGGFAFAPRWFAPPTDAASARIASMVFAGGGRGTGGVLSVNGLTGVVDLSATYQPLDSELTALAALTSAADKIPMFDGSGSATLLTRDTDGTLAANSDTVIATQKAVKAYVDTLVAGLLDFKGDLDCSANPNYPAALKGDAYYVSVAGKAGGASGKSVDIGDLLVAKADNAGGTEASVGTSWFVLEHNLVGAVISVAGTANRVTSTGGTTPVIDIDAAYVGQASITTLGNVGTGQWQATVVSPTYGGTGVNNAGRTLTINTNSGTISFTTSVTRPVAATASVSGTNTGDQTAFDGGSA